MTDYLLSSPLSFTATGTASVANPPRVRSFVPPISTVIINQNTNDGDVRAQAYNAGYGLDSLTFEETVTTFSVQSVDIGAEWIFQDFRLPNDFPLTSTVDDVVTTRIPKLTGLQVDVQVEEDLSAVASLDWRIDYLKPGTGWVGLAQGLEVGSPLDGEHVWFDINFDPLDITDTWKHRFRFGIRSRALVGGAAFPSEGTRNLAGTRVDIDNRTLDVIPDISPAPLKAGRVYPFEDDGVPVVLVAGGALRTFYGVQQGITKVWVTTPTPFLGASLYAHGSDGVGDLVTNGGALRFRILADVPNPTIDPVGNLIKGVVYSNPPSNIDNSIDSLKDAFWLSKPNPSQFAVESLYFDIRSGNDASVIDHMLIDPVTPGVYFHVYYSNDPAPGTDPDTWDGLMWTRVNRTFILKRRESLAFPDPITAKYIKIEFTRLQPRYYAPGVLQDPMTYTKHPRWVIDYYLALYERETANNHRYSPRVSVRYDALSLAYDYYVDDIQTLFPDAPRAVKGAEGYSLLRSFLDTQGTAGRVDAETLRRIRQSFTPFLRSPFQQGRFGEILKTYAVPKDASNYSTETIVTSTADVSQVSSLDRERLVIEKQFPVTSFYIDCRHYYKRTTAKFEEDRAYFAGLKELAFTRDYYSTKYDHPLYIETAGDHVNIESNDFETIDYSWATYNDAS